MLYANDPLLCQQKNEVLVLHTALKIMHTNILIIPTYKNEILEY